MTVLSNEEQPRPSTIVALSTPPGRSGIGVVRLSGPDSLAIVRTLVAESKFNPSPGSVTLKTISDPESGSAIDSVLITYFKQPHSFTGEDVVEISCHGSPVLLTNVIDLSLSLGANAAGPGEFTLRALSNGRINLSQAEAIRDLIDSETETAARVAMRQLRGDMSKRLQPLKDTLIEIIVPLESSLEFVEDDLPDLAIASITERLDSLRVDLKEMASSFRSGRLLRDGLKIVLVGRPNVGKSSVFNRLLASNRAIVTPIAGTTRDSLTERLSLDGIPVQVTDTAGIRHSTDEIESMGVERTRDAMVDADLVVVILDGSQSISEEDRIVLAETDSSNRVVAINKVDLETVTSEFAGIANQVRISAKTGEGFDALRTAIVSPFMKGDLTGEDFVITNARHHDLIVRAISSITSATEHLEARASEELTLVGLYDALKYLGQITGETTPDDILSQIFLTFCIGK